MPFVFTYTAAIISPAMLGLAAFVLLKRSGDRLGRLFGLSAISAAVWVGSNVMADVSGSHGELVFWGGLGMVGTCGLFAGFIAFFRELTGQERPSLSARLMYLSSAVVAALAFSRWTTAGTLFPPGRPTETIPGPVYTAAGLVAVWGYVHAWQLMRRYCRRAGAREVRQARTVFAGFSLTLAGALTFGLLLPLLGLTWVWPLSPQFGVFMLAFGACAIVRHEMFDIKVALQRGAVYSALLVVMSSLYVATLVTVQALTQRAGELSHYLATAITIAVGISLAPRLRRLFERLTDSLFFKDRCPYGVAIRRLSQALNRHVTLKDLVEISSSELKEIFRVDRVKFFLVEGSRSDSSSVDVWADCRGKIPERLLRRIEDPRQWCPETAEEDLRAALEESEIVVPVAHERRPVALVAMGPRLSGDPYSSKDVEILDVFSEQCAVAVVKAQLYMKLQRHSERLEAEVRNRTAELEKSYRERSDMMVDIAHSLQTPLTVMKGRIEAMRRSSSGVEELLALEGSVDKVTDFIRRLVRLASLSSHGRVESIESVDLSSLLRDIISYFEVMAEQEGITLDMSVEDGIAVRGNREQLEELMLNVLSNAVKYIANERRISIGLDRRGANCRLAVRDTGQGIPKESMDKLFRRFYRAPSSGGVRGTGLGLAICRRIAELHGGRIGIESRVGQGTEVTVELPTVDLPSRLPDTDRQKSNLQPA